MTPPPGTAVGSTLSVPSPRPERGEGGRREQGGVARRDARPHRSGGQGGQPLADQLRQEVRGRRPARHVAQPGAYLRQRLVDERLACLQQAHTPPCRRHGEDLGGAAPSPASRPRRCAAASDARLPRPAPRLGSAPPASRPWRRPAPPRRRLAGESTPPGAPRRPGAGRLSRSASQVHPQHALDEALDGSLSRRLAEPGNLDHQRPGRVENHPVEIGTDALRGAVRHQQQGEAVLPSSAAASGGDGRIERRARLLRRCARPGPERRRDGRRAPSPRSPMTAIAVIPGAPGS